MVPQYLCQIVFPCSRLQNSASASTVGVETEAISLLVISGPCGHSAPYSLQFLKSCWLSDKISYTGFKDLQPLHPSRINLKWGPWSMAWLHFVLPFEQYPLAVLSTTSQMSVRMLGALSLKEVCFWHQLISSPGMRMLFYNFQCNIVTWKTTEPHLVPGNLGGCVFETETLCEWKSWNWEKIRLKEFFFCNIPIKLSRQNNLSR